MKLILHYIYINYVGAIIMISIKQLLIIFVKIVLGTKMNKGRK